MADFTCAIAVRLASPTLTGRDINVTRSTRYDRKSSDRAPEMKMIRVGARVNRSIGNYASSNVRWTDAASWRTVSRHNAMHQMTASVHSPNNRERNFASAI